MRMDLVGHQSVCAKIAVVPQRDRDVPLIVRRRMDRAIFGIDHAPATLSLDARISAKVRGRTQPMRCSAAPDKSGSWW
jgi:hypothetical protein